MLSQHSLTDLLACIRTWSHPCAASRTKLCGHAQREQAAPHHKPWAATGVKPHCFETDLGTGFASTHSPKGLPRARCNGHTCPQDQPWGHPHLYSCLPTDSLCSTTAAQPQARAWREPRAQSSRAPRRAAGRAGMWGRGSSEEWTESRPRCMFSDYKISVFLFKVLSVNIPYYKSSTTVSTDCQY